jgi:hypothetical protein
MARLQDIYAFTDFPTEGTSIASYSWPKAVESESDWNNVMKLLCAESIQALHVKGAPVQELAKLVEVKSLEALYVEDLDCPRSGGLLAAMCASCSWPALRELSLGQIYLSKAALQSLVDAYQAPSSLRVLHLTNSVCQGDDHLASFIGKMLRQTSLTELCIDRMGLGPRAFQALGDGLPASTLESLELSNLKWMVSFQDWEVLLRALPQSSLHRFHGDFACGESMKLLASVLGQTRLAELGVDLDSWGGSATSDLTDLEEPLQVLMQAVSVNEKLETFDLWLPPRSLSGRGALFRDLLAVSEHLVNFGLSQWDMPPDLLTGLMTGLVGNKTMKTVRLKGNLDTFADEAIDGILTGLRKLLDRNYTLTDFQVEALGICSDEDALAEIRELLSRNGQPPLVLELRGRVQSDNMASIELAGLAGPKNVWSSQLLLVQHVSGF